MPEETTLPEWKVDIAVIHTTLNNMSSTLGRIETLIEKQNGRVRKLEEWRWKASGVVALVGILMVFLFKTKLIGG